MPIVSDQLSDLKLNFVVTDTLFIKIEEKAQKKIKIIPDSLNISISKPYRIVSSLSIQPDSLLVIGPKSVISQAPDTFLLRLLERNIDENFDEEVDVVFQPSSLVSVVPEEVRLSFNIEPFIRSSRTMPIQLVGFPQDSSAAVENTDVTLYFTIREKLTQNLADSLFQVTLDYQNVNLSDSTVIPRIEQHPDFTSDYFIGPVQFKVIYGK